MQKMTTRNLVTMALLAALSVVLARFVVPMPNATTRFSIEALPIIISGYLFGPIPGALVGFVADGIGTLFSGYGYNPFFAVPPILYGLFAGLLRPVLYKRIDPLRIFITILPAALLGSILWQSYWLSYFYGSKTFTAFMASRSIQFAITTVINTVLAYALFAAGIFNRLHILPEAYQTKTRKEAVI